MPLTEFYPHPRMRDGTLNKCKECARKDTANRHEKKSADPVWLLKEMERHRQKQQRCREEGTAVVLTGERKREVTRRYRAKYPEKAKAHSASYRAANSGLLESKPCEVCGNPKTEKHHEDYKQPLDVKWLCTKHHAERHVELRRQALLMAVLTPEQKR